MCVNNRADSVLWMNRLHKISITFGFNMLFSIFLFRNFSALFQLLQNISLEFRVSELCFISIHMSKVQIIPLFYFYSLLVGPNCVGGYQKVLDLTSLGKRLGHLCFLVVVCKQCL